MQQSSTTSKILNIFSIVCGVWFLLTSWCWFWIANVVFSFPVGILGIVLWFVSRKKDRSSVLNKIALWLHILGLVSSAVFFFLIFYRVIR